MLATGDFFDAGRNSLVAFVHVVRRYSRNSTARLVHTDGDDLFVIEGDGQRASGIGDWLAVFINQGCGVNDFAAFTHGFSRGQDHINFVDGVVDLRSRAVASNHKLLEVAARGAGDLDGLGALIDEHVIAWSINNHSTNGFAGLDGDGLLVIEGQGDVGVRFIRKRSGVSNLAAFTYFSRSRQGHGSGVVGARCVGDSRGDLVSARNQIFKVLTTRYFLDAGRNSLITFVNIIRSHNRDSPARLIHANGDDLVVIQSHSHWAGDISHRCAVLIHQGSGVNDLTTFTHGFGRGQHHINLVDGVVDLCRCAVACDYELLEVTAFSTGDLDRLGALIDEHVIAWSINNHGANGFAGLDGDGLLVVESQGDVGIRFIRKRSGVGDFSTFTHFSRSR
ncbi:hypothetical protein PS834_05601 [Pseudomonas fluorescens]|nr:hypothetical protein PS834_05601 [Pseudomonas fluorescens]